MNKITATLAAAGIGLTLPVQLAFADAQPSPPLSTLTAEWEQWALSIPAAQNPQSDLNGQFCMVGQRGDVWFLAGLWGGGPPVRRTCSIPENKALFFPVINNFYNNTPSVTPDCGQEGINYDVKKLISLIKPAIDAAHDLSVSVDGKPLDTKQVRRVLSVPFPTAFPADNIFGPTACNGEPLPAGIYSPSMDDGYYVLLRPLKPGLQPHTIKFHAESDLDPENPFIQDVTYTLTVVPVSLK